MARAPRRRTLSSGGFAANLVALRAATDKTKLEMRRIMFEMQQKAIELTPNAEVASKWEIIENRDDGLGRYNITLVNTSQRANQPLTSDQGRQYPSPSGQEGGFTLLDLWDQGGRDPYTIRPYKAKVLHWVDKSGRDRFATSVHREPVKATYCIQEPREHGEREVAKLRVKARGEFRFTRRGRARSF